MLFLIIQGYERGLLFLSWVNCLNSSVIDTRSLAGSLIIVEFN